MKIFLLLVAGVSVGLAYVIVNQQLTAAANAPAPVEDLAHKLQDAWADHHTVA
jgi:hypothetical protein